MEEKQRHLLTTTVNISCLYLRLTNATPESSQNLSNSRVKVHLSEFNTSSYPTDIVETDGGGFEYVKNIVIRIERHLPHPGYVSRVEPVLHDIGLVRLARDAPYTGKESLLK